MQFTIDPTGHYEPANYPEVLQSLGMLPFYALSGGPGAAANLSNQTGARWRVHKETVTANGVLSTPFQGDYHPDFPPVYPLAKIRDGAETLYFYEFGGVVWGGMAMRVPGLGL